MDIGVENVFSFSISVAGWGWKTKKFENGFLDWFVFIFITWESLFAELNLISFCFLDNQLLLIKWSSKNKQISSNVRGIRFVLKKVHLWFKLWSERLCLRICVPDDLSAYFDFVKSSPLVPEESSFLVQTWVREVVLVNLCAWWFKGLFLFCEIQSVSRHVWMLWNLCTVS